MTLSEACDGPAAAADQQDGAKSTDRIWTLQDLQILHELESPVMIAVYSVYLDPHRFVGFCPVGEYSQLR